MVDEKKDEHKPVVLVCAAVVAISGLIVAIVAMSASTSQSLTTVDKIVRMDAGANHGAVPTFTTIRIYKGLIGVGIGILAAATLGLFGANKRSKPLIAVYLGFTIVFSIVMFLSGAGLFMRITAVTPIIDRQVTNFCDATTYERLTANLHCDSASSTIPACGDVCQTRVQLLQRYDGCGFLEDLCTDRWEYSSATSAPVNASATPIHYRGGAVDQCMEVCSADIRCIGYVEASGCYIRSPMVPVGPPGSWITQALPAPSDAVRYHSKTRPYALPAFHSYGRALAFSVCGLAVVIVFSMVATCCHLYTVNVKRQGKHTGPELFATLLCPCWGKAPHEKVAELEGLASSEEE